MWMTYLMVVIGRGKTSLRRKGLGVMMISLGPLCLHLMMTKTGGIFQLVQRLN